MDATPLQSGLFATMLAQDAPPIASTGEQLVSFGLRPRIQHRFESGENSGLQAVSPARDNGERPLHQAFEASNPTSVDDQNGGRSTTDLGRLGDPPVAIGDTHQHRTELEFRSSLSHSRPDVLERNQRPFTERLVGSEWTPSADSGFLDTPHSAAQPLVVSSRKQVELPSSSSVTAGAARPALSPPVEESILRPLPMTSLLPMPAPQAKPQSGEPGLHELLASVKRAIGQTNSRSLESVRRAESFSAPLPQLQGNRPEKTEESIAPAIEIHIGRIDVKAQAQPTSPVSPTANSTSAPSRSLQAYLGARSRGARS